MQGIRPRNDREPRSDQLIDPQRFWDSYREAYRRRFCWEEYRNVGTTTEPADDVAKVVIEDTFRLKATREYFRIDWIGEEPTPEGDRHNWRLRIALEHENDGQYALEWRDELCKLAHVAADLCVIVSYWHYARCDSSGISLADSLQQAVDKVSDRLRHVPDRRWLFIFGTQSSTPDRPFVAFTLDLNFRVVALQDDSPLKPCDWQDYRAGGSLAGGATTRLLPK